MPKPIIIDCILWATAIVASASAGAPATFTLITLPALAGAAWLASARRPACAK